MCDGLQAVQRTAELRPDVVPFDIRTAILNGMEAAQCIRQGSAGSRSISLTRDNDADVRTEALATGAAGYVWKANAASQLVPPRRLLLEKHHGSDKVLTTGFSAYPRLTSYNSEMSGALKSLFPR